MLNNKWIWIVVTVVVIAALFIVFKGKVGGHVEALGTGATVEVGSGQ